MKRLLAFLMIALCLLTAAGCGQTEEVNLIPDEILSPVAIYSTAMNIFQSPKDYVGKAVQAEGQAYYSTDSSTGYYIRISDSTACCFVDLELQLAEGIQYPADQSYFQVFGKISSYDAADGRTVVRIEGDRVLYEDELRAMYEEEEE